MKRNRNGVHNHSPTIPLTQAQELQNVLWKQSAGGTIWENESKRGEGFYLHLNGPGRIGPMEYPADKARNDKTIVPTDATIDKPMRLRDHDDELTLFFRHRGKIYEARIIEFMTSGHQERKMSIHDVTSAVGIKMQQDTIFLGKHASDGISDERIKQLKQLESAFGLRRALRTLSGPTKERERRYLIWWAGVPMIENACTNKSKISWKIPSKRSHEKR